MKIANIITHLSLAALSLAKKPPRGMFDVLIIGGGPSGLSAAENLARQQFRVAVFDSGVHRIDATPDLWRVPGFMDRHPSEARVAMWDELRPFKNIEVIAGEVTGVERAEQGKDGWFKVHLEEKTYVGKKVILAPGWVDEFPNIPGYHEAWMTVLFNDPLSHRPDDKARRWKGTVLAVGASSKTRPAIHLTRLALRYTDKVVIFTHNNIKASKDIADTINGLSDEFKGRVEVDNRAIAQLRYTTRQSGHDLIIMYGDGSWSTHAFMFHWPKGKVELGFAGKLSLKIGAGGLVDVNPETMETAEKGVYAVGDCISHRKTVVRGVYTGQLAAEAIAVDFGARI
ncbi:hypothetical protein ACJ41O_010737 [Fusarium nematophilum]